MKRNHFILLFSIILFAISCNSQQSSSFQNIDSKILQNKLKDKETVLLDVRTKEEVAEGYIKGTTLFIDVHNPNFEESIEKLDKNKTYIVYCRSGRRSAAASQKMKEKGFKQVMNLEGGISSYSGSIVH